MSLSGTQQEFALDTSKLIFEAFRLGYGVTYGEAYRTAEQAAWNEARGTGITDSNHCRRLAVDLNLFKDGEYLTKTSDHAPLGEYWKSLHPENVWGGDFKKRDGNHYSRRYKTYAV